MRVFKLTIFMIGQGGVGLHEAIRGQTTVLIITRPVLTDNYHPQDCEEQRESPQKVETWVGVTSPG